MAEQCFQILFTPLWHGTGGEGLPHMTTIYSDELPDDRAAEVCIQTVVLCSDVGEESRI